MADQEINAKYAAEHLRDEVMQILRGEMPKPWQQMSEDEQAIKVHRVEYLCRDAIDRCVNAIAKAGMTSVAATMGKLGTDKDRNAVVPVTIDSAYLSDEIKLSIWKHIGRSVVIVLMDPQEYKNFSKPVDVDADEPPLPLEPKQPDWPTVSAAISEPEAGRPIKRTPQFDEPDAHIAEDDDEDVQQPATDLLDEDDDETTAPDFAKKLIDIPNPTKPKKPAKG